MILRATILQLITRPQTMGRFSLQSSAHIDLFVIRQVVLCKDADGKVGLRVKAVNKGVFVCLVARNSAAAMGGLRFGDQILQINGNNVAGFGENKASHQLNLIQLFQGIHFVKSQNCRSMTSSRRPR